MTESKTDSENALSTNETSAKQLEFQVLTVLNRLEEAVEKYDNKVAIDKLTTNKLESIKNPQGTDEIINTIQDAVVNLNLSKAGDEPNLAILPALRDADKLALTAHSIKHYILCLDIAHSRYLTNWIDEEISTWLKEMFGLNEHYAVFYDDNRLEGCVKLFRFLLRKKFPSFDEDGFGAFQNTCPVIFYNSPSMITAVQYLCRCAGLPITSAQEIPSCCTEEGDYENVIRNIFKNSLSNNRIPLMFYANTETSLETSRNITILRRVCTEFNVWLHLRGDSIAALLLLPPNPINTTSNCSLEEYRSLNLFDSFSVNFGSWLNVPALPIATIVKSTPHEQDLINQEGIESKKPTGLPLWTTIKCFGQERILLDITKKFNSCQKLIMKLQKCDGIKIISRHRDFEHSYSDIDDLFKLTKPNSQFYFEILDQVNTSVIFKFVPENEDLWTSYYCDKLNSWLCQVLPRELPVVPISLIDSKDDGTVLKYAPFLNTPLISDSDWESLFVCLDQQLDILKSTVTQKETLYKLVQKCKRLKLVELPDWAGLGGVVYIPETWNMEDANYRKEVNLLNHQIVEQLRNTDSAFSVGESIDGGLSCIRFGMVGWDSDVNDLINLVETVGKHEEESWNYIDHMAEVVKKGIETATLDLQKESENKLWEEGILRHVPVFGNIVNWWSPLNKENGGGIKGRSLDLTAGVIESTENIYRYRNMIGCSPLNMNVNNVDQSQNEQSSSSSSSACAAVDNQNATVLEGEASSSNELHGNQVEESIPSPQQLSNQ